MRLFILILLLIILQGCSSNTNIPPTEEVYLVMWNESSYGYMDASGSQIISPQYTYAMPFSEGLAGVNVGGSFRKRNMPTDGKWGFIDIEGNFIINPIFYSPPVSGAFYDPDSIALAAHEAYIFSEGLAAAVVAGKGATKREWVYVNKKGEEVFRNSDIRSARRFRQGLANVYVYRRGRGRWGYINAYGEMIIEPQFLLPADFRQGFALVVKEDQEKMLIDRKGYRYLPQYDILTYFINGYGAVRPNWYGERVDPSEKRKTQLVNIHGAPMMEADFDWIGMYGHGLAPALVGSKLGNSLSYPEIPSATIDVGGKWGFINLKGEFIINPKYQHARGFKEELAAVKLGGLWGYLHRDRSMITDFEFRWAGFFNKGVAPVRLGPIHGDYDGRYAYIDRGGNVIWIEPEPLN